MPARYVLSRFVIVSWRDGVLQVTSPVVRETFTYDDAERVLLALNAFAVPREVDGDELTRQWIDAKILVDADAPELAALQYWDRDALALHASSRDKAWRKTRGRVIPPAQPARKFGEPIPLAPPSTIREDLARILDVRQSRREWAKAPIAFQKFSDLLWLSARNRIGDRGREISRPYPSGGAAYSLELYPVVDTDAVENLDCGVYHYLPEAHALERVTPFPDDVEPFLVKAGHTGASPAPPVAIIITSRYARQSAEYGAIAYTLVLKEVGGLYQTLYLAAEALGLAACALGGGTPPGLLAKLCRTTEIEEPVVGEFSVGGRVSA